MSRYSQNQKLAVGRYRVGVALSALAAVLSPVGVPAALAQDVTAADPEGSTQVQSSQPGAVARSAADQGVTEEEIVVTGTILRGTAPVGSNLISVGEERIQEQGATTANELLATVPQVANLFNNVPTARLGIAANQIQVVRPNLRSLAPETSSSASTLVLFDGHRIAPVGVTQNAVDPDLIPPVAIERVEVVPDGGSATYGSDAVGGVINFITRKRFDGVQAQARYGIADKYHQVDAGAIVGTDWGSGSVYAAYNYQHNDAIFGRDRDYIRGIDYLTGLPTGRSCIPGNVQIGSNLFPLPALAPLGAPNTCDSTDDSTFIPSSTRHGAIASLHQELTSWLKVDLRAFYGERKSLSTSPFRGSATVTGGSNANNPRQFYYTPVPGQSATANQTVFFNLAPLLGLDAARSSTEFQEWGTNAEFQADLTDNWQLRTLVNYSKSNSEYHIQGFNQDLLNQYGRGTTAATAINFYNPTAADLPLIQNLINSESAGQGRESLLDIRAILDGTLFTLPGGDVKLAVGYEYMYDKFKQRIAPSNQPIGAIRTTPYTDYDRRIHAFFAEAQVPIFGEGNRLSFIHSLTLAASIRHDRFSDFGSTTNPKIGVNFKPTSWLGFRGSYSTSFNAPSLVDQLGTLRNTAGFFNFNQPFVRPGDTPAVTGLVSIQGANPGLMPQTAKSYSLGVDVDPPFVEGLRLSLNYYNVKYKDIIRQPSPNNSIYVNFPSLITAVPTGLTFGQIEAFLNQSGASNAASVLGTVAGRCAGTQPTDICNVYALVDFRQGNYGTVNAEGLDFAASYRTTTSFGGIDAGVSGNYLLARTTQTGVGAPIVDELSLGQNTSRLQMQATLGADIGDFRAQVTLNHTSGFDVIRCDLTTIPACTVPPGGTPSSGVLQDEVDDFNTVNLFFRYKVPGESALLKDLSFTLNINNVFDVGPPAFRGPGDGYLRNGGFTIGRMVQFGIQKRL